MTKDELIAEIQALPGNPQVAGIRTCCGTSYILDHVAVRQLKLNPDPTSGWGCSGGHACVQDWEIKRDEDGFRSVDADADQLIDAISIF